MVSRNGSEPRLEDEDGNEAVLPEPTLDGYAFIGWYDTLGNELTYKTIAQDKTFYASWKRIAVTGINSVTISNNFSTSQKATINASSVGSTITGYYIGKLNPETDSVTYTASNTGTIDSSGMWYFAVQDSTGTVDVVAKEMALITFNASGGTINSTGWLCLVGNTITTPAPTKPGYTCTGWYTTASSDDKLASASSLYTVNSDVTMYAHYTINDYTLTFNANGGSCATASIRVKYGSMYGTLPVPTRTGYTFNGWYTAANGGTKVSSATSMSTSNVTIYAQWTVNVYTLTFNANGGSCSTASAQVNYGAAYGTLPTPTRTGYTFNGWYTAASGGTKVSSATSMSTSNVTVYAQWTISSYTLTFNAGKGSASETSRKVNYNAAYGTLPTITPPTGYSFKGWYTAASGGSVVSSTTKMGSSNTTIYAQYSAKSYTLTYNANGGTCNTASKSVSYGSTYGTLPTPTRSGYTFNGWYTATSNGTKVSNSTKMGAANVTIYAQWTMEDYSKTFSYTGASQKWTAPYTGKYLIKVYGAQGSSKYATGGKGGYSYGYIKLTKGDILYFYVGGQGSKESGGWNGATDGGHFNTWWYVGGGGGGTDVRKNGTAYSKVIIAAGGGGGGAKTRKSDLTNYWTMVGGDGGGTSYQSIKTSKGNGATGEGTEGWFYSPVAASSQKPVYNTKTKGSGSGLGSGGGYYGGRADIGNNYELPAGEGGIGYIDGVTDGKTTAGSHSGNGSASITFKGN